VAVVVPAQAELFSPESFTGAAVGAIAGAVIGHNNGRHGGEGAAIGAGIGYLAGTLAHQNRERSSYHSSGYNTSPSHASVSVGYSSSPYYYNHSRHHHGYRGPRYSFGYSYHSPVYVPRAYVTRTITPQIVTVPVIQQTPAPTQAPVTIINNNYYNSAPTTPMASANTMFGR
jgi:hypothetical protein